MTLFLNVLVIFLIGVTVCEAQGPTVTGCPDNIVQTTQGDSATVSWQEPVATPSAPGQTIVYDFFGISDKDDLQDATLASGSQFTVDRSPYVVSYFWLEGFGSGAASSCTFTITVEEQTVANPCLVNPCQNGGACSLFPGSQTQSSCICPPCYHGRFCENRVDQCQNHKCENGAICQAAPNSCTDYSCVCPECFQGLFCEESYDPCSSDGSNPCFNGGQCSNAVESCAAFECDCQGCFTGFRCEIAIGDPCLTNPCENGGVCSRIPNTCYYYECTCPTGYTGYHCELAMEVVTNPCNTFPCQNGGSCFFEENANYLCVCPPGFAGINCNTDLDDNPALDSCQPTPCANGICFNQFDGMSSLQAYENQFTCVCSTGYTGGNCELRTVDFPAQDVCNVESIVCQNGGVCQNTYSSFSQENSVFCLCPVGYVGENCELAAVNPCNSNPCQNNGLCTPFNSYFMCQCPSTYEGPTCELPAGDDTTPPEVTCPDDIQSIIQPNQAGIAVTYPTPVASDDSGVVILSYSKESGTIFNVGTTTVSVIAVDESGNSALCNFDVTVTAVDTEQPTVTCPANIEVTVDPGQTETPVTFPEPTAEDNSGNAFIALSHLSGSVFDLGETLVTVTASDLAGNFAQCTFTVTVSAGGDTTPPTIANCPENIHVEVPPGSDIATATFPPPTATDASGIASIVSNWGGATTILLVADAATVVEYIFTDTAGNEARCAFAISASTAGGPTIFNCPPNQIARYAPDTFLMEFTWTEPTSTSGQWSTRNLPPGTFFGRGCAPVFYVFEDGTGSETCAFAVCLWPEDTVDMTPDTVPPEITCPANQSSTVGIGQSPAQVNYPAPTASDDSGSVTLSYSHASGSSFNAGSTVVTVIATDSAGNTAECSFTVTVTEMGAEGPPTIENCDTSKSPTMTHVSVRLTDPTATSGEVTFTEPTGTLANGNPAPFLTTNNLRTGSDFPLGLSTVVYTFGTAPNTASCTIYVYVLASNENNCASNPCQEGLQCFFNNVTYICRTFSGRRRRGVDLTSFEDECIPTCNLKSGVCASSDISGQRFRPQCFCRSGYAGIDCGISVMDFAFELPDHRQNATVLLINNGQDNPPPVNQWIQMTDGDNGTEHWFMFIGLVTIVLVGFVVTCGILLYKKRPATSLKSNMYE